MKKKLLALILTAAVILGTGASRRSQDETKLMSTFISNFTELGMYYIDIDEITNEDLIAFGIGHNVINNAKSTVKRCGLKNCEYGPSLMSGAAVKASVKKYFDVDVNNESLDTDRLSAEFDGMNYHFNAAEWRPNTVYYADVKSVTRGKYFVQMDGELYNVKRKSDRPALFTAKAKPYKYNGKDTWSIITLRVEWTDEN
ncbi:MAG: hypothetical protein IJ587_01535 [Synergistaceae bacterium]|nr:hypothetical protein [Synergistaceae bacterium]